MVQFLYNSNVSNVLVLFYLIILYYIYNDTIYAIKHILYVSINIMYKQCRYSILHISYKFKTSLTLFNIKIASWSIIPEG